ncbi:hypothetical protein K439DRAFT_1665113 [Ramaria rubella]|nr:hypothetical protein K439DRAFT_1665113 [Ramaria rubella]
MIAKVPLSAFITTVSKTVIQQLSHLTVTEIYTALQHMTRLRAYKGNLPEFLDAISNQELHSGNRDQALGLQVITKIVGSGTAREIISSMKNVGFEALIRTLVVLLVHHHNGVEEAYVVDTRRRNSNCFWRASPPAILIRAALSFSVQRLGGTIHERLPESFKVPIEKLQTLVGSWPQLQHFLGEKFLTDSPHLPLHRVHELPGSNIRRNELMQPCDRFSHDDPYAPASPGFDFENENLREFCADIGYATGLLAGEWVGKLL